MRVFKIFALLVAGMLLFAGCNLFENKSSSASMLTVDNLKGYNLEGSLSDISFSDVETSSGVVLNDNAQATLTARPLNPDLETFTPYMNVVVDQIDVEYSRADGLKVQGADVPYSFSQKVNFLVEIGSTRNLTNVLIQQVAKLESPLVELINIGQEKVLKLEAKVTFHSQDVSGHRLSPVSAYISIWCANFADNN